MKILISLISLVSISFIGCASFKEKRDPAGGQVEDRTLSSNFPTESAVNCTTDIKGNSGIELNIITGKVQITEWWSKNPKDRNTYLAVDKNPAPGQHIIWKSGGDFKNYFILKTGLHNHEVKLIVSQVILGGENSASGAFISKGLAIITHQGRDQKFDVICADQP